MSSTVVGIVKNGAVVPNDPLPEGAQVEIRLDEAPFSAMRDSQDPALANPWLDFAGMFKDDPMLGEWKQSMARYWQKIEDDPAAL